MAITRHLFLLFTLLLFAGLSLNSYAGPVCGDGNIDPGEECDNGGDVPDDFCTNNNDQGDGPCTDTFCGDGVRQTPENGAGFDEACDDGANNGVLPKTCSEMCEVNVAPTTTTTTTTTTAPATTTTTTTAPATTTTTAVATTTTTTGVTTTTTAPPGGDNIEIDGCDTGVSDPGGIQAGIDQCEADASNHGQFVRCVAIFTKAEGVPQSDRKGIMKCAAHSSIDGPGSTALSEGGNVPDNTTGTPAPSSSASSQSSVAAIRNVTIDGRDTGVADSDGSIQASVEACADSAASHRKFVKCVGKVAKSLKRSGDITKREKKRMKKAAKKSSIGSS